MFAQNDSQAAGVIAALDAAKITGKIVVGFDGNKQNVEYIAQGKQYLTSATVGGLTAGILGVTIFDQLNGVDLSLPERFLSQGALLVTPEIADDVLKTVYAPTLPFDWAKMSKALHPDDWDPQTVLNPIDPREYYAGVSQDQYTLNSAWNSADYHRSTHRVRSRVPLGPVAAVQRPTRGLRMSDTKVSDTATISLRGVCKSYGPVHALQDVSLDVSRGDVLGLIGENGAGKSTLIGVLTGTVRPDAGKPRCQRDTRGTRRLAYSPRTRNLRGGPGAVIGRCTAGVREHLSQGREGEIGGWGPGRRRRMRDAAQSLLDTLGIEGLRADAVVAELTYPQRQLVEIARAFSRDHRRHLKRR